GIRYFIDKGYKAVNIVWATGLRFDHSIGNLSTLVKLSSEIDLVMWDDNSKVFCLKHYFEKWYAKGTPISLVPVGEALDVTTTGLKYNLNNEVLILGDKISTSNEANDDGLVKIEYKGGALVMMECRDLY